MNNIFSILLMAFSFLCVSCSVENYAESDIVGNKKCKEYKSFCFGPDAHSAPNTISETVNIVDELNKKPPEETTKMVLNKKTIHYVFDNDNSKAFSWWKSVTEDAIGIWNKDLGYEIFSRESGETKLFIRYIDKTGEKTDNGNVGGRLLGFRTKNQTIEFFKTKNRHREIALHELGHSIGLDHSIDKNDLMYETVTAQQYPSANDIAMAKLHIFIGGSSD